MHALFAVAVLIVRARRPQVTRSGARARSGRAKALIRGQAAQGGGRRRRLEYLIVFLLALYGNTLVTSAQFKQLHCVSNVTGRASGTDAVVTYGWHPGAWPAYLLQGLEREDALSSGAEVS